MKLEGCSALITGASAGIGRELARQLAPKARRLILVARRRERLEELKRDLARPSLEIELLEVDLSDLAATNSLGDSLPGIDFLINNAGLGDLGPFATAEIARVQKQVQVNVLALTVLTRAALPKMLAQGKGAILNVSSSASFLPMANFAVYAATKAYVTSFSEAIRAEVRGHGVTVTALCPGPVRTEFSRVAHRDEGAGELGADLFHVPVDQVARAALRAVEREKPLVIPGVRMRLGMTLARLMPLSALRFAARFQQR